MTRVFSGPRSSSWVFFVTQITLLTVKDTLLNLWVMGLVMSLIRGLCHTWKSKKGLFLGHKIWMQGPISINLITFDRSHRDLSSSSSWWGWIEKPSGWEQVPFTPQGNPSASRCWKWSDQALPREHWCIGLPQPNNQSGKCIISIVYQSAFSGRGFQWIIQRNQMKFSICKCR